MKMNPIQGNILFKLFQQVNERIWYYDTATDRICYVAADGSTEEAIPFDEHMAMKHPDDCQQVYDSMEYMVSRRESYPEPLMIRYRDNKEPDGYRYTLNAITPIFEGNVIHVVGSEQDITPMVRKLQFAEQQAKLIGELLRHHHEDTYTVSRKRDLIHISRQNGKEEELTIDELINTMDVAESEGAIEALEAMRRGEARLMEYHIKEKEPRNDGNRHVIKGTSMPSKYDYRGNVLEYIGVGTDVTKEVSDKRKLRLLLAEVKKQSDESLQSIINEILELTGENNS